MPSAAIIRGGLPVKFRCEQAKPFRPRSRAARDRLIYICGGGGRPAGKPFAASGLSAASNTGAAPGRVGRRDPGGPSISFSFHSRSKRTRQAVRLPLGWSGRLTILDRELKILHVFEVRSSVWRTAPVRQTPWHVFLEFATGSGVRTPDHVFALGIDEKSPYFLAGRRIAGEGDARSHRSP
jgi:hypothetical protein